MLNGVVDPGETEEKDVSVEIGGLVGRLVDDRNKGR